MSALNGKLLSTTIIPALMGVGGIIAVTTVAVPVSMMTLKLAAAACNPCAAKNQRMPATPVLRKKPVVPATLALPKRLVELVTLARRRIPAPQMPAILAPRRKAVPIVSFPQFKRPRPVTLVPLKNRVVPVIPVRRRRFAVPATLVRQRKLAIPATLALQRKLAIPAIHVLQKTPARRMPVILATHVVRAAQQRLPTSNWSRQKPMLPMIA